MKKKAIYVLVFGLFMAMLVGCSKGEEKPVENPAVKYGKFLNQAIDSSNSLLQRYNTSLDKLYIGEYSSEQFSVISREMITTSNELIVQAEEVDASIQLYDFHTKVVKYLNNQHQLFLTSIDLSHQAIEKEKGQEVIKGQINKEQLRSNYLKIKDEQSSIIKEWKQLTTPAAPK